MQIHEITQRQEQLDERLLNLAQKAAAATARGVSKVGSAVQAVKQPFQSVSQAYTGARQAGKLADVTKRVLDVWTRYAEQLKQATPDPVKYQQLYAQALASFVQKNLLKGTTINQAVNQREITALIQAITQQADNPTAVQKLMPQLVQQSALAVPQADRAAPMMVKVISLQPAVLQFRNKVYTVGNQGEWNEQGTGKVPDETFQQFLDQQLAQAQGQ